MKMKRESEVAQSCPTLSDPMDHSLPDSSVHEIFQAKALEWGATALSDELATLVKLTLLEILPTVFVGTGLCSGSKWISLSEC